MVLCSRDIRRIPYMKTPQCIRNTSPHLTWHGQKPSINELITFGCDIYPITSSPKKLDDRKQEGSFMGYTNICAEIKWWDPHTKKLKYCSFEKLTNITINLVKDVHQVLKLCLTQILPSLLSWQCRKNVRDTSEACWRHVVTKDMSRSYWADTLIPPTRMIRYHVLSVNLVSWFARHL